MNYTSNYEKPEHYGLHAVLINSHKYEPNEAIRIFHDIIKSNKKSFFRVSKNYYRFRNISKQKFIKSSFKTKKINDDIKIVFGILKPEYHHLSGGGFFTDLFKSGVNKVKTFFSPRLDSFNNTSTETLKNYGNREVLSLTIYRTPISNMLNYALNAISLGRWNKLRQEYGFDKLFHLALVANVGDKNVIMEKNEAVNISTSYKTNKDTEVYNVNLGGKKITINDIVLKTRERIGDINFFDYDPFKLNCQVFIKELLTTVGLYDSGTEKFLFQDLKGIYDKLQGYVPKVAKAITRTGAIFNKLSGQGDDELNVEVAVSNTFKHLNSDKASKLFYEFVKKEAEGNDVGLYFIQQLYPKWLKTKEAKELINELKKKEPVKEEVIEIKETKKSKRKVMTEEEKKAKKREYDAKRYQLSKNKK
jgi:hypothetical protein